MSKTDPTSSSFKWKTRPPKLGSLSQFLSPTEWVFWPISTGTRGWMQTCLHSLFWLNFQARLHGLWTRYAGPFTARTGLCYRPVSAKSGAVLKSQIKQFLDGIAGQFKQFLGSVTDWPAVAVCCCADPEWSWAWDCKQASNSHWDAVQTRALCRPRTGLNRNELSHTT